MVSEKNKYSFIYREEKNEEKSKCYITDQREWVNYFFNSFTEYIEYYAEIEG